MSGLRSRRPPFERADQRDATTAAFRVPRKPKFAQPDLANASHDVARARSFLRNAASPPQATTT